MARVTVEDCVLQIPNRFELVMLAAQRSRDISAGAPLSLDRDNDKNPVVALREIAETTLDLDVLKNALIKGLQKVPEADEPEEEIVDFLATEQDLARDAAAAEDVRAAALSVAGEDGVAGILTAMHLDGASIATALLHDVIEDTGADLAEIEKRFGPEIARLVDGVTKLPRIELQSDHSKQAENFRKLVLAMSEDIRVLLVKLADRLHNMRTLNFITDANKRRRIAHETMDIYAPLAERIGIQDM